jgi:hypothetical protein
VEVIPYADIPQTFKNFVMTAVNEYSRPQERNAAPQNTTERVWVNADGMELDYVTGVGDVQILDKVINQKYYTLAIANIPYRFGAEGSENDNVAFAEVDIIKMVQSFKKTTTSDLWRFVIIHSLQQTSCVLEALRKSCNAGVESGMWSKPNINGCPPGNWLAWGFKNWSIGYNFADWN